jgi:hypothetical protein
MSIFDLNGPPGIDRITRVHKDLIMSWWQQRGKRIDYKGTVSDLGFIADGRVAGWLYLTNSRVAMIEGIIADPCSVPSLRKASVRKLTGFLIDTALSLGYTRIFGISKHPGMARVSKEFGFKENVFKVYTLSVEKD